jgi:hypothetical protein
MGLTIELQDENGNVLERIIDSNLLSGLLPREDHSLLSGIDPYGDTVFNRLQMEDFLIELSRLDNEKLTSAEKVHLSAIEQFALKCRNGIHLYLKFVGD